jgi:hypothetical protein
MLSSRHVSPDCIDDRQYCARIMFWLWRGIVGDYLPEWAGGYPKGLPPRPGTPEYDAFRKKQEEDAAAIKAKMRRRRTPKRRVCRNRR